MNPRTRAAGPPEPTTEPPDELDYLPEPKRSVFRALSVLRDQIEPLTDTRFHSPTGEDTVAIELAYRAGVQDCLSIVAQTALRVVGWPGPEAKR